MWSYRGRYGHLLDRLNRSRYLWDESAKVLFGAEEGGMVWTNPEDVFEIPGLIRSASSRSNAGAVATAPARPAESALAPETAPTPEAEPTTTAPEPASLPPEPRLSLDDADHLFGRAEDQHQIADILLGYARRVFDRAAIFKVMPDKIGGWKCSGDDIDAEHFATIALNANAPSIFVNLRKGESFHLGPIPPLPIHLEVAKSWGGSLPKGALFMPISVRGRMVCVLYGDRRSADVMGIDIQGFQRLAEKAAMALELFILRRKVSTINA